MLSSHHERHGIYCLTACAVARHCFQHWTYTPIKMLRHHIAACLVAISSKTRQGPVCKHAQHAPCTVDCHWITLNYQASIAAQEEASHTTLHKIVKQSHMTACMMTVEIKPGDAVLFHVSTNNMWAKVGMASSSCILSGTVHAWDKWWVEGLVMPAWGVKLAAQYTLHVPCQAGPVLKAWVVTHLRHATPWAIWIGIWIQVIQMHLMWWVQ